MFIKGPCGKFLFSNQSLQVFQDDSGTPARFFFLCLPNHKAASWPTTTYHLSTGPNNRVDGSWMETREPEETVDKLTLSIYVIVTEG